MTHNKKKLIMLQLIICYKKLYTSQISSLYLLLTHKAVNTVSIFYCEGHGVLLQWTVEGSKINNDTKQERGIEITTTMIGDSILSELYIIANFAIM